MKDQAFIVEMMRDTAQVPNCAAVLVMIDSRNDPIALTEFGEQCREELEEEAASIRYVLTSMGLEGVAS